MNLLTHCAPFALVSCLVLFNTVHRSQEGSIPEVDRRAVEIRNLDMSYTFRPYKNKEEWLARANYLRQQILVSAGLWPLPDKAPLNPQIFGRIERGEYTIEKVYFESYPGFYVTGNLYRPVGKKGPFPGILTPHGHWRYGRLENSELGSIPARCINLARQGYVIFSYDMVGYNDSRQVDHRFIGKPLSLWGIGPLSLQLWNSIRSIDFLESLPDVDKERLACTGASGGGTQTFLLTAVDDRIKVSAPVNMISHYMQGGDVCENISNLRLDTNNMEIGALMAPRPLLLVSAAGDWTRDAPRIEFPAIQSIYKLLSAEDKVHTVQFFAQHNYNKESREAVYSWFGRWVLNQEDQGQFKERPVEVELPADVLVFYGRELPKGAKTQQQLIDYLIQSSERQIDQLKPRDAAGLAHFRELMWPALQHSLAAQYPDPETLITTQPASVNANWPQEFFLGRRNEGDRVPAAVWTPKTGNRALSAALLIHPEGKAAFQPGHSLVGSLLKLGYIVMSIDTFNTGAARANRDMRDRFFTTYNRTDDANRVQDILTALAYLKKRPEVRSISLVGFEKAGLWCLLARALAPEVQRTVADASQFNTQDNQAYLEDLYIPLIRRAGDFRTALTLAPTSRLLIHNTGTFFDTEWVRTVYQISQATSALRVETGEISQPKIIEWLK